MTDVDAALFSYYDQVVADVGPVDLYDAHTHVGLHDPDGFKQTPQELIAALESAGARGVVFPAHEPGGYSGPNDRVLEAAERSDGRLVAFCRVDPHTDAVAEARRCFDAGARGIKLHPRAERFTLSHPTVRELVALAHERRAPVLIHAGRGIPALGQDTVALSGDFPGARMILAHAGISDLAWLWKVMPDHPNLFLDTAWWSPSDLIAMFHMVAPSHILWASDSPYGHPLTGVMLCGRTALQAGLTPEQLRGVLGGQLERVLDGEEPLDLGPPPAEPRAIHPLLERVVMHLTATIARAFVQADHVEALGLARLACAVGEDGPHAEVHADVLELLDLFEEELAPPPPGRPFPAAWRYVMAALWVARTPDVPLPPRPGAPAPTREEAE
jgi:predicted TIM-barrel fold metal-dependent hydrolase